MRTLNIPPLDPGIDELLSFAFGLTDRPPAVSAFGVDPHRARGFVQRTLNSRGLKITPRQPARPAAPAKPAATAAFPAATTLSARDQEVIREAKELRAERERLERELAATKLELARLQKRKAMHLASIATPGQAAFAAGLQVPQHPKPAPRTDDEARFIRAGLPSGLRKFAASIKLPGQK